MKTPLFRRTLHTLELGIRRSFLFALSLRKKRGQAQTVTLAPNATILFLRQDRIGDAIVTTPLLVALQHRYPDAHIMMLLGSNNQAIRDMLPVECETFIFTKNVVKDRKLIRQLRSRKIDVLIDLTDNASVTSSILISSIQAKTSIGIEKENGVVYDILVPRLDREETHISRRIAELLRPLGIDPDTIDLRPRLRLPESIKIKGRVGINISAGGDSRYAPVETYSAIASSILHMSGISEVAILCQPSDGAIADAIVASAADDRISKLPPSASYKEFAGWLATCEYLITPDTSVVHLGAAVGIPMVVIYAPIPEGLHYWTPTGVTFEMMIQMPTLETLEPEPVVRLFQALLAKTKTYPEINHAD
ncbi:MAG: glycosyltransferase family 9 protein [Candidatus Kapaibacterium sp.]